MNDPLLSEGDPLNGLAEEFLQRYRRGERPNLAEYTARHPELAARIDELFPAIILMERFGPPQDSPRPVAEQSISGRLGEYRLVRELGRGGMGIVYEAVQESLGRRVAVKVLSPALRQGKFLQRFQREACAAARLHHSNIVPVFGVGEHEGQPYYVMQFIDGRGLDKILETLQNRRDPDTGTTPAGRDHNTSLETNAGRSVGTATDAPTGASAAIESASLSEAESFRGVARLGVQAATALAYAHSQGVLHRDIKPSNLLLDNDGRLWITDFGLAKAGDSADLTETGDVVGTLRYLAPERLQGPCDARADVYSLGITLYELLTRQSAFAAADRARLLEQIAHHRVTPPRRVNAAIPRELEIIILKAMTLEPADRYASAEALAEDLQRFLDDRPILARRPTWGQKLKKWGRRNKGIVWTALTAAVVLLLTVMLGTGLAAVWLNKAWHVAEDRADKLQEEVEALKDANNLIEEAWSHSFQQHWPQAEADLAQAARRRPDLALVWTERCEFHLRLGLWDRAADDSLQALAVQEHALPWFWYRHAVLRLAIGDLPGYRQACRRVLERCEQATNPELLYEAAHCCLLVPDSVVDPQRLLPLAEKRPGSHPKPWHMTSLGLAHFRAGNDQQAFGFLQKSFQEDREWSGRAMTHCILAMVWHRQGQLADARIELGWAAGILEDMTQEMLHNEVGAKPPVWWIDVLASWVLYREARSRIDGSVLPDNAKLHVARARGFAALQETDRATDACAQAMKLEPQNAAIGLECGWLYGNLGWWDKALPLLSQAATAKEADARLGRWWFPLAIAYWQTGDKEQARLWYARAAQWMVRNQPRDGWLRRLRSEAAELLAIQDHRCFHGHTAQVRCAVFSSDGARVLSAGYDGTLRLWDAARGKELRCLRGHHALVWSAALSPDGDRALSGSSDHTLCLWDLETGKELRRLVNPAGGIMSVAYAPDGRRALAGGLGSISLWDLENGQQLARWEGHTDWVRSVVFSPDGSRALSGCQDKTVRLWDVATGKELRRFLTPDLILSVAFSPDGRQALAGGCDQTVHVWDLASGKELRPLRGHQGNVESVAFSPDGRWVLSGGADGTIRLWHLPDGSEGESFGTEEVLGVAFSPDGRQILSAHADNQVRLWRLKPPAPEKAAGRK